jgi:urea transport system substrate-binding protein
MSFVLETEGFHLLTAPDGRAALEAVEKTMPDLVLLDMKMPIMNVWEFAAEFHRRYGETVPIVVVTAAENAEKRAEEIGAAGWVAKPFDVATLVRVVRRFVEPKV